MANTHRHLLGDQDYVVDLEIASATVLEIGDLTCLSSSKAIPVSSVTGGDAATRQAAAAAAFAGVSRSASANGDTDNVDIDTGGLVKMAITSGTYKAGQMVAVADSGTALKDQEVVVTAYAARAIGVIWRNMTAAGTEVWVRIFSRTFGPLALDLDT